MLRTSVVVAIMLLTACGRDTTEVHLSEEQRKDHWRQLEVRSPIWFRRFGLPVPVLPPAEEVWQRIRIVEFAAVQNDGTSCYFDPDTWTIKIGSDKWASGCVAHELGHAALRGINHPCKSTYEHDYEIDKCRAALN